jgi:hypothetical protein
MNSRRSLLGLFGLGAVAVPAAVMMTRDAAAEPRKRKFVHGKLICRCEAPEFDVSSERRVTYEFRGCDGSHTHTISDPGHSHTHTMSGSGSAHTHTISTGYVEPVWITATLKHCIFCGGIEGNGGIEI